LAFDEESLSVFEFSRREDDLNIDYRLYVASVNVSMDEETLFVFTGDDFESNNFDTLLEHVVFGYYEDEQVSLVSFNEGRQITNQPTVSEIAFGALVALLLVGVYLVFRTS
jgi:hypothetical protein